MIGCFRKIGSRAMALPFACTVLTACLLESGVHSALAGLKVDTQIKVGIDPWGMAFSPDGNYLYVVNVGSNTVSVIDTALNQVVVTIPLADLNGGEILSSVVVTPDGSTVFVLDGNSGIAVISTSTNTVSETISAGPSVGTGLAITKDGDHLYVANAMGTVTIINVATYEIEKTLTVGTAADGVKTVAISPDGNSAYAEVGIFRGVGPNYLTKIDVASETIVAPQLGAGHFLNQYGFSGGLAFSPDSFIVYVPTFKALVLQFNANTGQMGVKFHLDHHERPRGIQASPNGKLLWVADNFNKTILTINTRTGNIVTTPLGGTRHPNAVVLSPNGSYLVTSNWSYPFNQNSGTVSRISR